MSPSKEPATTYSSPLRKSQLWIIALKSNYLCSSYQSRPPGAYLVSSYHIRRLCDLTHSQLNKLRSWSSAHSRSKWNIITRRSNPLRRLIFLPLFASHVRTVESGDPEAITFPEGWKAILHTPWACPSNLFKFLPEFISQSLMVWSWEPLAMVFGFVGWTATVSTELVWPWVRFSYLWECWRSLFAGKLVPQASWLLPLPLL